MQKEQEDGNQVYDCMNKEYSFESTYSSLCAGHIRISLPPLTKT